MVADFLHVENKFQQTVCSMSMILILTFERSVYCSYTIKFLLWNYTITSEKHMGNAEGGSEQQYMHSGLCV